MQKWAPFSFKSLTQMKQYIADGEIDLPISDDISVLGTPIEVMGMKMKNRLAIHPMTSFDCTLDGTPSEKTFRRYCRYAAGGAGLMWFESCAVSADSKSNMHDCMLTDENLGVFQQLIAEIKANAADGIAPITVLQLTHCGRNSGLSAAGIPPYVAVDDSPYLKRVNPVYLTDDMLRKIQDQYVHSAKLAKLAGFDAIDMRACHGFLISELLSAYTRKDSIYGGESFENRTRFLVEVVKRVKEEVGIPQALRLNVSDLVPYPYGWGMKKDGSMESDFEEPFRLTEILRDLGVALLSISVGRNHIPHIQMPYNRGSHHPEESQLDDMAYYLSFAKIVKDRFPDITVMSGALSWAGIYSPNISAGAIETGIFDIAAYGRMAYANPDFANQIIKEGGIRPDKACICCERCADLRSYSRVTGGCPAGCVIRDSEIYLPLFRQYVPDGKPAPMGKDTIELFHLKPM